ncbi:MAG: YebG family protein, partial [bacterium]|nr:YebG family protein [bacterium]
MTVETRYVVIRENTEVKTFMNKKEADEYDKLLDSADLIRTLLEEGPLKLTEDQCEEISYYLAQNKDK